MISLKEIREIMVYFYMMVTVTSDEEFVLLFNEV